MPNLLTRLFRRSDEISRYTVSDYIRWLQQGRYGLTQPYSYGPTSYANGKPAERIENSYEGYVYGAYKSNPVVFGCMTARSSVFSEARFMWRRIADGRPGDLFSDDSLGVLARPWPNGTTGELLTRMIQDVDLAGNFYAVHEGDRLRRLRPDWVSIVLSGDPRQDQDVDVLGYVYTPGGPDNGNGRTYLPDELVHWSPIPDPDALYRGMSWLTPVVREIQGDQAAVDHKLAFFRAGATLGPIIKVPPGLTPTQFKDFVANFNAEHQGTENAYRPLVIGNGADVTLQAATMQQLDFKGLQGSSETRLCVAARVPAVIAGVSEGLAGSSLNAGNYGTAKRSFADGCLRPLWRSACAALQSILDVPADAELWYDERDIAFLRDDEQDIAQIQQTQSATINSYVTGGWKPDTAKDAVLANDISKLEHSGAYSVQLQPPGSEDADFDGVPDAEAEAGDEYTAALEEFRAQLWDERDEITRAAEDIDVDDDDEPGQFEIERKYYDVRFTSGPKGGQFRKISDRVGAALNDYLNGDGGDDDPLEKFTQPQLKQAAKDFGITTTPRAGKAALKLAIFNDAKSRHRTQRDTPTRRASFTLKGGGPSADEVREIEVENKIRAAYRDLKLKADATGSRGRGWVNLADLRDHSLVRDLDRAEIDDALKALIGDVSLRERDGIYIEPEMNQGRLTPRDRGAAVRIGGENNHYLRIDRPSPRPVVPKGDSKLRDLDVGVYVEAKPGSKIYLRRENGDKPSTILQSFDSLDDMAAWADEHGEKELGDWARLEATGDAPKTDRVVAPSRTKKALDTAEARKSTKAAREKLARSKKSRTETAPGYPDRASVPDAKADPSKPYPGYDPPSYTAASVLANDRTRKPGGWADPVDPHDAGPFTSYEGPVAVDAKGRPVNPVTRTGIQDRGLLGKWGANYAADPIITRVNPDTGELEMAAIRRGDSGEWAIPGGMVDEGEAVSATLAREFREETGADLDMSSGREVYKGFVDDPRNTDNAWMETTAVHLHLTPEQAEAVQFKGPDDPGEITDVRWAPVDDEFLGNLYASHGDFVREALRQMESDKPAKAPRKAAPPAPSKSAAEGDAALGATAVSTRSLSSDEVRSLGGYGLESHHNINGGLRAAEGSTSAMRPKHQEMVADIDGVMARSPLSQDIVVYRGLGGKDLTGNAFPLDGDPIDDPDVDWTGRTWTDHGYSSTSATQAGAKAKTSRVMLRVVVPSGTPAISGSELDPGEVLLARGLTYRVVKDGGVSGGQRHLDVDVVPVKPATPDLSSLDTEARFDALASRKVGTVNDPDSLKGMLSAAGLKVSGRKGELVDRLVEHLGVGGGPQARTEIEDLLDRDLGEPLKRRTPREGDVAVWSTPGEMPAIGRVRRIGNRTVIEWEGGRSEKLSGRRLDPSVTLYADDRLVEHLGGAVTRAVGHDTTPGHDNLHHYWTVGEGLARWTTWTELYDQLLDKVGPVKAKVYASDWFRDRYGYSAGSDLNRVRHGKPPRGDRVGPG